VVPPAAVVGVHKVVQILSEELVSATTSVSPVKQTVKGVHSAFDVALAALDVYVVVASHVVTKAQPLSVVEVSSLYSYSSGSHTFAVWHSRSDVGVGAVAWNSSVVSHTSRAVHVLSFALLSPPCSLMLSMNSLSAQAFLAEHCRSDTNWPSWALSIIACSFDQYLPFTAKQVTRSEQVGCSDSSPFVWSDHH